MKVQLENSMRILALLLVCALIGCSSVSEVEQSLAQCDLEYGPRDIEKFRDSSLDFDQIVYSELRDYEDFTLLCMKSKGFVFEEPFDDSGDLGKCWMDAKQSSTRPHAVVNMASCYSKYSWF